MKTKLQLFFVAFFCLGQITAQVTMSISYYNNKDIEPDLWGFHMSNFFESCRCYDPEDPAPIPNDTIDLCMQLAANLKPRVLRFPAGGESKLFHLTDSNGYGRRYGDIAAMRAANWIKVADSVKLDSLVDIQEQDFENIPFLERMVDFVDFCDTENGYAPEVIFVANVLLTQLDGLYSPGEIESENLAAIRYLLGQGIEIVGIELGNEHYDDRDKNKVPIFKDGSNQLSFNSYYQACLPLLDSLDSDTALAGIPVSLVAAPEPIHGEAIGKFGSNTVSNFNSWNKALKDSAQSITAGSLFDAYSVHLYNVTMDMPWCYNKYYEEYESTNPNYAIEAGDNDSVLVAAWQCANDSFQVYTQDSLKAIMNNWAGSCADCLGSDKPYWMTEWGQFAATENIQRIFGIAYPDGHETLRTIVDLDTIIDTLSGDFRNTFIDGAFAFQFMLEMTDYEAGAKGTHLADVNYMIKHNYLGKSLGGIISEPLNLDDDPPSFYRRAKYWPFIMMQDIYHKNYERVITTTMPLDGETRKPFIKCFYYDNPASFNLPASFCIEEPSGFTSPVFYMYFYNPYLDDITFKHEEMTGWEDDPEHPFNPSSDNAAFMKYVDVAQLYNHGGTNQWMMDNSAYSGGQPQDITGISQQVVDLCNGDSIVLPRYSYGYVYWGITPEPFRMTGQENTALRTWPVPAQQEVYLQVDLPDATAIYQYKIFNISGQLVAHDMFPESGYLTVQRNRLAAGMYLFQLTTTSGELVG